MGYPFAEYFPCQEAFSCLARSLNGHNRREAQSFEQQVGCEPWAYVWHGDILTPVDFGKQFQNRWGLYNVISVQRNIAACTASNHELPEVGPHSSADQRITFEHIDRPNNVVHPGRRVRQPLFHQMIENALKVIRDRRRQLDSRHA